MQVEEGIQGWCPGAPAWLQAEETEEETEKAALFRQEENPEWLASSLEAKDKSFQAGVSAAVSQVRED